MKLICIDTTSNYTHTSVQNRSIGASEYQLYNLLKHLRQFVEIQCFNHRSDFEIIDSIQYDSLQKIEYGVNDIVVIQRFFPIHYNLPDTNNRKIIWLHDIPDFNVFLGNDDEKVRYYRNHPAEFKKHIETILTDASISFVANSNHTKEMFLTFVKTHAGIQYNRCEVIYNIMYAEEFDTSPVEKIHKRLLYASAWQKGIEKIIDIFRYVVKRDPEYTLAVCSPGYDWENYKKYANEIQNEFGEKLILYGPSNKLELSKAIKESMCCMTSMFNETFGCVFAESYFLGTPVVGDIRSGAVREIIGDTHIVDYNSIEAVWETLQACMLEKPVLGNEFLLDANLLKWKCLLQI
jgi:glycosyltransferase involved in cell wall biosynthesis